MADQVQKLPAPPSPSDPYPEARSGRYVELPLQPLASMAAPWIVTGVLAEHDNGQFQRSALLWEQMRRDDRVSATMSVRINALLGLEHDFKPSRGETETPQDSLEALEDVWKGFATPAERAQILSWALGVGFAFGRLELVLTEARWSPRLSIWHPSFVSWRANELLYYVSTANAGQVPITPGVDGWWLWTPWGYKRGWSEGYVHKLAMPWLARSFSYRDWCRYNEIHGLPMVKAFIPAGAQDDDETRYMMELANRGSAPVVRLPRGKDGTPAYDFELVEAKADTWEAFQGMKNDANVDIAVAVLGQNLTTEVQGGSYAAAKVQDKVRGDILDADARGFEAFFNAAVVAPFALYNLPNGAAGAPELRLQTNEAVDTKATGDGLAAIGAGVSAARAAGIQVDVDELTRRTDIPTTGGWKEPPPPPPLPPGGPFGAPGHGGPPGRPPFPNGPPGRQVVASEDTPSKESTQEMGQAYADAIVAFFAREGGKALSEDRLRVLSVIMAAESFHEMQAMLESAYADMSPDALAELLATAGKLAELNGWYSARGT